MDEKGKPANAPLRIKALGFTYWWLVENEENITLGLCRDCIPSFPTNHQ